MPLNTADSLMSIFGLHRAKCRHCVYSLGTDKQDMYCERQDELVKPDSQCEEFMREVGSEE